AVDEDLIGAGVDREGIGAPDHHVGALAALQRAGLLVDADGLGRIQRDPADGVLFGDVHPGAATGRQGGGGFLVQALDQFGVVRVDDGARALGRVGQGGVLLDAVQSLHLEAPPAGPHGGADAFARQHRRDLVGLDRMVEGRDLVAELLGHIEHDRHLVGAVAVVLDQDRAVQHAGQGLKLQVAGRGRALTGLAPLVPLVLVVGGIDEGRAIAGHVAHARGGRLVAAAVDARRVFAAGHLQAVGGAGELHPLHGHRGYVLEGHAAAAEQVGRAGQDLHRRHPARAGGVEAGVLRPDRVLGPDLGGVRVGGLVAVAHPLHAGRGIDAQVAVNVDDARRDEAAARVDHPVARRDRGVRAADGGDAAVGDDDDAALDLLARAGQHRGADDGHVLARPANINTRIGVLV
uniref:Phenol hydroxylase n=1 Tax=Parastrongyloides trichosuri TaxID=131310 RepID=A0A0N4Z8D2_PARTI